MLRELATSSAISRQQCLMVSSPGKTPLIIDLYIVCGPPLVTYSFYCQEMLVQKCVVQLHTQEEQEAKRRTVTQPWKPGGTLGIRDWCSLYVGRKCLKNVSIETFGDIWRHLQTFGDVWRNLETFGDILETFGEIWRHFRDIWRHLETFGDIWRHFRDIRRHSTFWPIQPLY